jgi:hypothetical protein
MHAVWILEVYAPDLGIRQTTEQDVIYFAVEIRKRIPYDNHGEYFTQVES